MEARGKIEGEKAIQKCLSVLADKGWLEQRTGVIYAVNSSEDWEINYSLFADMFGKGYLTADKNNNVDRFVISKKGRGEVKKRQIFTINRTPRLLSDN